jgi:hypothetical protein
LNKATGWAGAFSIVTVVVCSLRAVAAGPHSLGLVLEPTYTFCISGNPPCSSAGRTSAAAQYKPIVTKKLNLRIKLSRAYVRSPDDTDIDDVDVASNQSYRAAADSLDVRVQLFDDGGYEREEPRIGYAYQHPVGSSGADHTSYISDSWFFGRRILRGTQAPARQFRVAVKFSQNVYQSSSNLPQAVVQVTP